jgi:membrane-bound metal-dependent hydrolase YbcI (DUF457 family)
MNREEHILFGIIAFIIYMLIFYSIIKDSTVIFFSGIACVIGSILPDILEPANNWMHRGICHSIRALKFSVEIFAITVCISVILIILFREFSVFYVSCLALGYLVHLLADSTTEVGLPD